MATFYLAHLACKALFNSIMPTRDTDDWYSSLDLGRPVSFVSIALKKAFDAVNRKLLFKTLEFYNAK